MKTTLVTAPTGMLISLDEAKTHLRVDHTEDDGYIQALIMSGTAMAETITNRRLLTQTWKAYADEWPAEFFTIPFGNLQSVTSVLYKESDATESTMTASEYIVDVDSDPGRVVLGYNETWPNETLYPSNPIYIQFVCGYGAHTLQTVTGATNAGPIVITLAAHGYVTGNRILIANVVGNTNANGAWNITKVTDASFSLDGSTGNAAYISGGTAVKLDVPDPIRAAILLMIGNAYKARESIFFGGQDVSEIPEYIMNLLWSYRLWKF